MTTAFLSPASLGARAPILFARTQRLARSAAAAAARPPRRACAPPPPPPRASASDDSSGGGGAADAAARVASAFIAACVPGSAPYAQQLAGFCAAVADARGAGYALGALLLELGAAAGRSEAALGRPLQAEEVELRSVWVTLVYKTLRISRPGGEDAAGAMPDQWDTFVKNVCAAHERGYDQKRILLEQTMAAEPGAEQRTPMESAVLQQAVRIVLSTLALDK